MNVSTCSYSLSSDDAMAKTGTTTSSPCPDNTSAPSASITSMLEVKVTLNAFESTVRVVPISRKMMWVSGWTD